MISLRPLAFVFYSSAFITSIAVGFMAKTPVPAEVKPVRLDFNRDISPILAEHCWQCHGTDAAKVAKTGGVRFDTFAEATKNRSGQFAIVPGKPNLSRLWIRMSAKEPGERMPPVDSGVHAVPPEKAAAIKRWIEEGAEYKGHWAFAPPQIPVIPPVSNPAWVKTPIDNFILARLDKAKLKPEAPADGSTILRRASLTLTGLPPTPEEVSKFLADSKPGAYERAVDRILAKPAYGEHQARYWLDAVRYGDTHGLHLDNERGIWPYRDWVVDAYNRDLPFDKFTVWQLAGDLLPKPTPEQRLATGYVRMNPTTAEGGAIEQEFLVKNTIDRVDTTSSVYLGITMGCARCHDHKYDPLSQRDYYRLFAFMNSTTDSPLDGNAKDHPPVMKVPSRSQSLRMIKIDSDRVALERKVDIKTAIQWASEGPRLPQMSNWEVSGPYSSDKPDATFDTAFEPESGLKGDWRPIEITNGKAVSGLVNRDNAAAYLRVTLTPEKAESFTVRLSSDDGIRVWLNGKLIHSNNVQRPVTPDSDVVKFDLQAGANQLLVKVVNGAGQDGFYIACGSPTDARVGMLAAKIGKAKLTVAEEQGLRRAYLESVPEGAPYRDLLAESKKIDESVPTTLVAEELKTPRPAFILNRGEYDQPTKPVTRGIPSVFGELPAKFPKNRLGLAEWLVSPKNPLVARVFVNRMWQQHFGTGLVKSVEDFGSRGEYPSHPELLDYLATTFIKDGWSMKKLHRMIVCSATYRQSAVVTPAKHARDPENRLLSHGPRFRLDAEVIRDQALQIAGILDPTIGGQGVKPYQPGGLWEAVGYTASNTARYMQDKGTALHRRSLYTFWKRTSPPPSMLIFDAPMRESCVLSRSRTNTPLQALVTMNDPQFVEASRMFAERVIRTKSTDESRLNYAWRLVTARSPKPAEVSALKKLLTLQRARYAVNPSGAKTLLAIGEIPRDERIPAVDHASWTIVCNALLNLDEALTQH